MYRPTDQLDRVRTLRTCAANWRSYYASALPVCLFAFETVDGGTVKLANPDRAARAAAMGRVLREAGITEGSEDHRQFLADFAGELRDIAKQGYIRRKQREAEHAARELRQCDALSYVESDLTLRNMLDLTQVRRQ